jgi:hypothetical protein
MSRRASPGLRLRQVAEALLEVTTASGRGATVVEIREAYQRLHGTMDNRRFPAALQRLEKAGVVHRVGGRHRRTQWAHVDSPVPFDDPSDEAPLVLDALKALCGALLRPVSAPEVAEELQRRGELTLTNDQVRTRLESLAHASERKADRTVGLFADPLVRRHSATTVGGRRCLTWSPIDNEFSEAGGFRDAREAARYAVGRVVDILGRPASRREIIVWARAVLARGDASYQDDNLDREAAALVVSRRFRQVLAGSLTTDEARGSGEGMLRSVRTPLSSRGPYPARISNRRVGEDEASACLVADLAALLLPVSELDGIRRLQETADELASDLLKEIADARRVALASALRRSAPRLADDRGLLEQACNRVAASHDVLRGWGTEGKQRASLDLFATPEVEGFLEFVAVEPRTADAAPRTVDQSEGVGLAELEEFAREALEVGDRGIQFWSPLVSGVRRLRGPTRGGISCEEASETESRLDRPEAIVAIASAVHLPVMSSLVSSAYELLGYVVRDADVVEGWLDQAGEGDAQVRSALVVALGLLGRVPPLDLAWPDPADIEQAVAYCASLALGVDDPEERVRLAEEAEAYAACSALQVVETVLGRVLSGCRLSVIG